MTEALVELDRPAVPDDARVRLRRIPFIAAALALLWAARFPETALRVAGLHALGSPRYEGFVGMFIPHVLFYSTTSAICAVILWTVLARARVVPPPRFPLTLTAVRTGLLGGLLATATVALAVFALAGREAFGWIGFDGWKIAGNLFSNFFEELIFRGFVLTCLGAVVGFWPAAVASSLWWAATHVQYPLSLRAIIACVGILFCWETRRARSVLAPYVSHQTLDVILDAVIR